MDVIDLEQNERQKWTSLQPLRIKRFKVRVKETVSPTRLATFLKIEFKIRVALYYTEPVQRQVPIAVFNALLKALF